MKHQAYLTLISILLSCCQSDFAFSQGVNNLSITSDKSISINFRIKEIATGKNEVELKNFTVLAYRAKEFVSLKKTGAHSILVVLKNENGEIISQQNILSPLTQHLEIPSEDGHIESTEIKSNESEFNVRLPYNNTARLVEVYQLNGDRNKELLAAFVLR